jgi:hypothetical protein
MNPRKRSATETLYSTRSAKHPRTARNHYTGGDNRSPTELEARWKKMGMDLINLAGDTLAHLVKGNILLSIRKR